MTDLLYQAFLDNENELVADIMRQLKHSTAKHYVEIEQDMLHLRIQKLVANFAISLRDRPGRFVAYIEEMAEERIAEGYVLNEILMALRILEERAWRVAIEDMPRPAQITAISRVTGTVGAAKDKLANIYIRHLERAEQEALVWQRRYEELAATHATAQTRA